MAAISKFSAQIFQQYFNFKFFKMAEGLSGCSGEALLAPCATKKRKMIEGYYWIKYWHFSKA